MKKNNFVLALSALLTLSSFAINAESIKSDQEIVGSWLLEYSTRSEFADEKDPMGITWVFKDNKLIVKDIPQVRGDAYDATPVNYLIEEGLLKISILGRPSKFDIYTLVKKIDNNMVLKDVKHGNYLYFKKK